MKKPEIITFNLNATIKEMGCPLSAIKAKDNNTSLPVYINFNPKTPLGHARIYTKNNELWADVTLIKDLPTPLKFIKMVPTGTIERGSKKLITAFIINSMGFILQ